MFQPTGTVLCCFPAVKCAAWFRSDVAKGLKLPFAPFLLNFLFQIDKKTCLLQEMRPRYVSMLLL